ncbi:WapI family immunity protein [Fundidesulfovibrio terrae]|uniref:WapI family immunity protein n=1 Tax=Fundidesulfovibrio terrae TaxID=2922866 RepID=UPI001FAF03A5|nr:hypothetical protein [Fundidesulfovibrio terrae]
MTLHFDGGWIILTTQGYEYTSATDYHDANWLRCNLEFKIDGLTGKENIFFLTTDIISFKHELQILNKSLQGSAVLSSTDNDTRIEVKSGSRGDLTVSGHITKIGTAQYSIDFNATSDQTMMTRCLEDLQLISEQYPTINIPS